MITQMPLRLPQRLHEDLKIAATEEGVSLNQYCLYLLARHARRSEERDRKRGEDLLKFVQQAHVLQAEMNRKRR